MHVRVARFEGVDSSQVEEDYARYRQMLRAGERPDFMPEDVFETLRSDVRRVMSFVDREAGATLDLTFTDDAASAQRVHEALDSLSPPDGAGRRSEVGIYEQMLDEQL
jgi:hypothetical protein